MISLIPITANTVCFLCHAHSLPFPLSFLSLSFVFPLLRYFRIRCWWSSTQVCSWWRQSSGVRRSICRHLPLPPQARPVKSVAVPPPSRRWRTYPLLRSVRSSAPSSPRARPSCASERTPWTTPSRPMPVCSAPASPLLHPVPLPCDEGRSTENPIKFIFLRKHKGSSGRVGGWGLFYAYKPGHLMS